MQLFSSSNHCVIRVSNHLLVYYTTFQGLIVLLQLAISLRVGWYLVKEPFSEVW